MLSGTCTWRWPRSFRASAISGYHGIMWLRKTGNCLDIRTFQQQEREIQLDSVVGTAVAQNAADLNLKFQKGIQTIWKMIKDIAGAPVPYEDEAGNRRSTIKLAPRILDTTRILFKVSASHFLQYLKILYLSPILVCLRDLPGNHLMHDIPLITDRQLAPGILQKVLKDCLLWLDP